MAEDDVTRRLAAILAADVAGYTRLMEADENATIAAWKAARIDVIDPKIAQYRGRIVKHTGDGFLAEFGSVTDAVNCAIDMQKLLAARAANTPEDRRMNFRMGVNLGDIVEELDDIHGDGVNIAARLEGLAEPGGICVSGSVYEQVRKRVDLDFEDLGSQKVKNIAEPIRTYRIRSDGEARAARTPARWWWAAAAAVVVGIAAAAAGHLSLFPLRPPGQETPLAQRLSIVVLPFDNLSDDKDQGYFADAITEDLITDLSRIRGTFVIARGTSFTYKGKAANAKDVATELNVRYVLEGSVRRSGDQVRVNAQLIDGETGAHIWSDRFDREFKNAFALQSAITGRIAAVLKAELLESESRHLKKGRPANLEAWDYAVQGQVKMHNVTLGPKVLPEAKELYERALKLDPNLALAWEGLAFIHFAAATREIPGVSVPHSKKLALEAAQKAVSLDPRSSGAHVMLGLALYWNDQPERALASCEAALDLNRNNEHAYLCVGQVKNILGKPAEAIPLFEKAQQLNPRFRAWLRHMYIGMSRVALGEYDKAVIALKKAKAGFPKHPSVNLNLATALALQGRVDEARAVLAEYMKLALGKRNTIEKLRADREHLLPNFERIAEALRRAGMPER